MQPAEPDQSAVLVRVPVSGNGASRNLPPTPPGTSLTVTLGSEQLAREMAAAVAALGYRVAGVSPGLARDGADSVDVLVPAEVARMHPTWFSGLLQRASRAFDCDLGPVQLLFREELAQHRQAMRIRTCG